MRKKIDKRILAFLTRGLQARHRTMFIIVGDRGRDQVVNIHYMLSKCGGVRHLPTVLWCYKKELNFSSHKKKRMKQIKAMKSKGMYDEKVDSPFEQFVASTEIRYCYYKDSHTILGNTYEMLVLQDFESITPNVLCRTIETVEGGGVIVVLLNTMTSLRQLYTITMDVHDRFRTQGQQNIEPRFNERFILSLAKCQSCIVMDDELNVLPISSHIKDFPKEPEELKGDVEIEEAKRPQPKKGSSLVAIKTAVKSSEALVRLVDLCRTADQAKAAVQLMEGIAEKRMNLTMTVTAARGRGKSAAIGIGLASAVTSGYSNILITAPHPQNVKTLFEFLLKGLDALGYKEHADYELLEGTREEWKKCVVRISIFKTHRQTIQYIDPQDYHSTGQAEILAIDEAAAIPLPIVKKLLGPYMVIMSSTIHGYEGTGRSLSLKLFHELRTKCPPGQLFKESTLAEPIRYDSNDPIEKWLYDLLCLDATDVQPLAHGMPHANDCNLYYINRDTLFSGHALSEQFLKRLWSLFVSSHYKNSPNDLQLLSDAPAHCVFALLDARAVEGGSKLEGLPDIMCAIQCAIEGNIAESYVQVQFARGARPSGDLIPWTVCEQFQDKEFAQLTGIRIVRIAVHPDAQGKGYGSRALELLQKYYEGVLIDADEIEDDERVSKKKSEKEETKEQLKTERIKPKKGLKPIMQPLSKRRPLPVHYLGTSYGITEKLYNFWSQNKFAPLYIRQTLNELTGEHTCVMVKPLQGQAEGVIGIPKHLAQSSAEENSWLAAYSSDFRRRFISLLGFEFRHMSVPLVLSILNAKRETQDGEVAVTVAHAFKEELKANFTTFDVARLESYTKNLVDYHMILDLVPPIARCYFQGKLKGVGFSFVQLALLAGIGLQYKKLEKLEEEINIGINQLMAMFNKAMRKTCRVIREAHEMGKAETVSKKHDLEDDSEGSPSKRKKLQ
eukprot:TRINITY_DN9403_c0_g4_i3.p1 TRINITY_DN9403_c0_g4~~TRINITY_DN9403_c0_g4_i3.p1  ORF type:complete len:953 (-),score=281.49 TRINITY_DN9403_c0_g4_i3:149-3007(-)